MATAFERAEEMAGRYEERITTQRKMIDTMQSKLLRIDKIAKEQGLDEIRAIVREARSE